MADNINTTTTTISDTPLTDALFNDKLFTEGFINDRTPLDEHNLNLLLKGIRYLRDNKVSVENDKALSTNDFTDDYETKLNGIEAGAQVNVTPDWDASEGDYGYIDNKPTVDQTYGENSTNAQSGTAVAGAISGLKTYVDTNFIKNSSILVIDGGGVPTSNYEDWNGEYEGYTFEEN